MRGLFVPKECVLLTHKGIEWTHTTDIVRNTIMLRYSPAFRVSAMREEQAVEQAVTELV